MKNIFLIAFVAIFLKANSQSTFKTGVIYQFGMSTIYGASKAMSNHAEPLPVYALKANFGLGVKSTYCIKEKFVLSAQIAYQQRGAKFDVDIYNYTPKYSFNYVDFGLGLAYRTKELIKKSKIEFGFGGTYNRLISASRTNNYETYNITNDLQLNDFGSFVNLGIVVPRMASDEFVLKLYANSGFKDVFSGVLKENGLVGKNLIFGIQFGYLLGKNNKI